MTAQMFPSTVVSPQLLAVLEQLSPELRQQVFDFAEFLGQKKNEPVELKCVWASQAPGSLADFPEFEEVVEAGRKICEGEDVVVEAIG